MLKPVEVQTAEQPTASIIWLHGLGSNGHDFEAIVPELSLPQNLGIRFIFPHAQSIPVTINGGMLMPAWYNIFEMNLGRRVDTEQLMQSASYVHSLIEQEIGRGIDSNNIVLAGFSQGGAVVFEAGLTFDKPLAGVMALSTYLATQESVKPHPSNESLPFFLAHGTADDIVPETMGQHAKSTLDSWGYQTQYHRYPMAHSVCMEEINDISKLLASVLT